MQRALIMLVLGLPGCSGTIRMVDANFKAGSRRAARKLRDDHAREYRMQNKRVGGDPADQPAP
jgi:hypothetical protein